jgi:hypothetical protein
MKISAEVEVGRAKLYLPTAPQEEILGADLAPGEVHLAANICVGKYQTPFPNSSH